jgi:hypothetical protein
MLFTLFNAVSAATAGVTMGLARAKKLVMV